MHFLTKRSLIVTAIMLVLVFLVFYFVLGTDARPPSGYSRNTLQEDVSVIDNTKELKMVHLIFRHGARTPADTYPNDPHINETFYPYGWGELTNNGKSKLYETGKYLRTRYNKFLGKNYSPAVCYGASTGVSRTKMSLQLVLAGLWPPKGTDMEWNKNLNWQPIAFDYQPIKEDNLLLVRTSCPRYHEELQRVYAEEEGPRSSLTDYKQLYDELTNLTGLEVKGPDDVQSLYFTLRTEVEYGLKLPEWTSDYYPEKLLDLTEKSFIYNVYNEELQRIKAGPLLSKLIGDWNDVKNNQVSPKERKIFAYAGHDATVVNILMALKVWQQQIPDYGMMGMFELYQDTITNQYGVRILLRDPYKDKPQLLVIPGCECICPLEKLIDLARNVVPQNTEVCNAKEVDYTEPPPKAP